MVLVLCLMTLAFGASVIGVSQWRGAPRIDLTEDGLYTLSPGTLRILDHLQGPINLTLYFSRHATRDLPKLRSYDQRVSEMLQEMASRSRGQIHLETVDPVPYSVDEDRALGAGLTAVPGGTNGERVFFGLAGSNTHGENLSIAFFDPNEEAFLEYSIAKLLYELNMPAKPRVDIISSLPIAGDPAQGERPWAIMRPLRQLFDIHMLDAADVTHIGKDVKALLVVHPKHLPSDTLFAIDQYVLRGGHLVVFVDPDAEMDAHAIGSPYGNIVGSQSSLPRLFKAWGISFNPDEVVLDRSLALSITLAGNPAPVRHPAMLGLTAANLNQESVITTNLHSVDVSTAGHFELAPDTTSRLIPLMQTSGNAMLVPSSDVLLNVDPSTLYEHYRATGEHYVLATLVKGTFHTAFPNRHGAGDLQKAAGPNEIILVADTDILSNRMWVQSTPFLGRRLLSAFAGNGDFVTNTIDYLTGSSALLSIRGHATSQRPFERVAVMRRAADERFQQKEHDLESALIATEQRLTQLRPGQHSDDKERREEITHNIKRRLEIRKQLREVQHELNAEIDALGDKLRAFNILLVPSLLTLLGIGYGLYRSRRKRRRR